MEVLVGKLAGFCPGVSFAVNKAIEVGSNNDKVYCYGELVHNKQVIEELEEKGITTVEDLDCIPNGSTVIFRAHGVKKVCYEIARSKGLNVVDLTCGNVKIIHDKVEKASKDNFIIIIGDENHPENIGTKDFAGQNSMVINSSDEILDAYKAFEKSGLKKVYVVSQTTFNLKKFEDISKEIEDNFCEYEVFIDNTICATTEIRQENVKKLSKEVDTMVVIGGKNSANTKKLVEISSQNCSKVYHVQTKDDLKNYKFFPNDKIGIAAGASTPQKIIDEIKNVLMEM